MCKEEKGKGLSRLLLKFLLFFCVVGMPLCILNHLYKSTNYYQSSNDLYWLKTYPDDMDLVNLGNSHEQKGLRYSGKYSGVAHNLATASQPFEYDYYVLQERADSIVPGALVLIPVSYYDFEYDYPKLFNGATRGYNTRYYSLMKDKRHIFEYSFEDDLKYNYFAVLTAKENLQYLIEDVELPILDAPNTQTSITEDKIVEAAEWKASSWKNEVMVSLEDCERFETIRERNMHFLEETIMYCYERGFVPVMITSPVTAELTNELGPDCIKRFDQDTAAICERYPDLQYLDYSRDTRFANDLTCFVDSDHLSNKGADCFTSQVLNDLVCLGYLSSNQVLSESKVGMTE